MAPRKDAATQGIAKLKRQHGNARRLYEQSSRAVEAALEQHARELTKELAKERAKSSGLLGQLKAANAKAGEGLRAELDAERKKISQVRAKLNEANAKLKAANDRGEGLRAELDAERKKISQVCAKLNEANAKLKAANDRGESVRAEAAKQRDNCAKMTVERDAERKKSADLENQLTHLRDKDKDDAMETMQDIAADEVAEEKRSRVLVISNLPESGGTLASKRQEGDEEKVEKLLDALDVQCRPLAVYRVGRPAASNAGGNKRSRFTFVELPHKSIATECLKRKQRLRKCTRFHGHNFSNVYIERAMSKQEQEQAYQERAKRRATEKPAPTNEPAPTNTLRQRTRLLQGHVDGT